MKDQTIASLVTLLEQQLQINRTILNASVPHVCSPEEAAVAGQLIRVNGGFASYVLNSSRAISEVLDNIRSEEDGAGTA